MITIQLAQLMQTKGISVAVIQANTQIPKRTILDLMNQEARGIQFDSLDQLLTYLDIDLTDLITFKSPNQDRVAIEFSKAHIMLDNSDSCSIGTDLILHYNHPQCPTHLSFKLQIDGHLQSDTQLPKVRFGFPDLIFKTLINRTFTSQEDLNQFKQELTAVFQSSSIALEHFPQFEVTEFDFPLIGLKK
ncbi:helix-turn-helix domain-containing protein [Vaginisenegalia massiliensis]|uniref:helix-turn-helix domain-containing protein n=1 Tax=Vaginisenegalia massiliensis TaxID=2058294 RepID=UPI000F52FE6E|nr:helix-turn-helix transcriptional regulator [Vaginisenegalia massiliensis]